MLTRNPYPGDYGPAFACSIVLYPPSRRWSLRSPTLSGGRRAYRVQSDAHEGVGPLFPPVVLAVHGRVEVRPGAHHLPFWRKPVSIVWLVIRNDV